MDKEALIFFLKQEYPTIFETSIKNDVFIFRPLTRFEYENIVLNHRVGDEVAKETICELCVVYPEGYDFENCDYAGIPSALSDQIIEKSGWGNDKFVENYIEELEDKHLNDPMSVIENQILAAFPPKIKPEEIKNLDIYTLLDYFIRSKSVLEIKTQGNLFEEQPQEGEPVEYMHADPRMAKMR
jgi:hypothetical protein